jgi:hypothetical protein
MGSSHLYYVLCPSSHGEKKTVQFEERISPCKYILKIILKPTDFSQYVKLLSTSCPICWEVNGLYCQRQ